MALASGVRLGVYEVRELIGAGGMGEVYRALDTKLNREVALKILPDVFANDPDRLARFKREAQVLASLNHSNIASIFGFEESTGVRALVLELVHGPTLADRIAQGTVPLDDALPIARQIADALEAAHAQGVIHRDLKPANIKIRPDGTVKVLDFGLAKMFDPAEAASRSGSERPDLSPVSSPTITSPAVTQIGVVLGTAAYMSPEQARGKPADKRSDIWAFGAVLYEMLTGKRAFDGDEVSDTLASILKSDTNWNTLPADTPPAIRRVLRRCLQKEPKRRIHDIADARLDLDDAATTGEVAPPSRSRVLTGERVGWAILMAALAGGLGYTLRREPPAVPVVRFQITPPPKGFFGSNVGIARTDNTSGATLSPDGSQLAFVATTEAGRPQIWLRRMDSSVSRPINGTDEAAMPFWSPDGRSIGFFAEGHLKRTNLMDNSTQTIAVVPVVPRGATWGSRDVIVFSSGNPARLSRVSSRGGQVAPIETPDIFPRWPTFLPNGEHFVYFGRSTADSPLSLMVGSIEPTFTFRELIPSDSNALFAAPDLLLFIRGDSLLRQSIDLDRLDVVGDATPVVEQVFHTPGIGRGDFSVSATGVLVFRSTSTRTTQFAWFDRAGKQLESVGSPGNYRTPDLSPDGTRLAYADINSGDIWIFDLKRQTSSRFTTGPGTEQAPVWFPDGTKIAYRKDQGGVFEKDASGTGTERLLLKENINGPTQISSDGKWLVYFATGRETQDVYVLPMTGDRTPVPIVETAFSDVEPQLSPDARWLAYASLETGRNEVYVQPFPPTGKRWQISNAGGRQPLWRADGKELFFVADDRKFFAVDIKSTPESFDFGMPRFLFEMRANVFNTRNSYIPSRDGQRFLVNMLLEGDDAPINVVQNWPATLTK